MASPSAASRAIPTSGEGASGCGKSEDMAYSLFVRYR
jgi:hypothetical protein